MFVVFIRFIELFVCSVALSAATRGAMAIEIVNSTAQGIGITFFIGMIIFIAIQVNMLRRSFFNLQNRREYIIYNFSAYFIFALVSTVARVYLGNVFHTWTFGIYKFMMFANADMLWWQSALYGHILMAIVILLAPIGTPTMDEFEFANELDSEGANPHELMLDMTAEDIGEFNDSDSYPLSDPDDFEDDDYDEYE